MLVKIKKGVIIKEINDHFFTVCGVVSKAYSDHDNVVPVLTSAAEGKHMKGSYHPEGLAWDFRTRGLDDPQSVAGVIRSLLRGIDLCYDVVYGGEQHLDHIHIEWDRRRAEFFQRKGVK